MAPQAPDQNVKGELLEEEDQPHSPLLEKRELKINVRKIIHDLRHLDWSKVVWRNAILFMLLHFYSVYGIYLAIFVAQWKTIGFSVMLYFMAALGITMGAHRLWSHRSFKATLPLRVILAVFQTLSFQNDIFEWARDHRVHHKYSETDADPHNARRGFFFSHMGWLMYRKHPDVITKGRTLDVSDLQEDKIVMWQRKHYVPLVVTACFVLPTVIPWVLWEEHPVTALMVAGFLRYNIVLHVTWFVNSLAHWVGSKPFDKNIYPSQNPIVAYLALGEGWHNYHHVFPWDYRTAEFGGLGAYNITSLTIDFCSKIGLAYDLKTVSPEMIEQRAHRTGDGSRHSVSSKTE
ncbi:acyl-CoA Delta-9 desaturase [Cherax quadricarinatus]|uniref:Delta-9 acyl-CoA desaturase n=1 Tax=Cherax quadricarinatus TaxID=27406 RepID=A0A6S4L246_CHEQU|nr:acyl-CoA Delta-9 desaturase-like [Cherax quadricarinatus]AVY54329.1 delta-9 acyl-CoA desaturase [Cherax quadricarinatus]